VNAFDMLFYRLQLDALESRTPTKTLNPEPTKWRASASANANAIILGICLSQIKAIMLAECKWGASADDSDIRAN